MLSYLPSEIRQPDVVEYLAAFGEYVKPNKQNIWTNLYHGLFNPGHRYSLDKRAMMIDGLNTAMELPTFGSTHVLQAQNTSQFNAKGEFFLGGKIINPEAWKIEILLNYEKIWKKFAQTWALRLRDIAPNEINIPEELHKIVMAEILKRLGSDMRESFYRGVKTAGSTNHLHIIDGFNKKMKDAATAGVFTPVPIVATGASDVFLKMKALAENLGSAYLDSDDCIIKIAPDVWAKCTESPLFNVSDNNLVIVDGQRVKTTSNLLEKPFPYYPNVTVINEPYLKPGGMVATLKENFVAGFDSFDPGSNMRMKEHITQEFSLVANGTIGCEIRAMKADINGDKPFICNDAAVA
jgi:hypothetical protein